MVQRLENFYQQHSVPKLIEQFHYKNKHQVPKLHKIVINRGLGDASQNAKLLESCSKELSIITGQQGVVTRSKKAIASFKLRQKMPVGVVEVRYRQLRPIFGFEVRPEAFEIMFGQFPTMGGNRFYMRKLA